MPSLLFTSGTNGKGRTEVLDGRDYLVSPVVLLVEMVLRDELVPMDEISRYHEAWNGRPFVLGHPVDADGRTISANSPATLAETGLGYVFNVTVDEPKLKGELWLDIAKANEIGGDALAVAKRLENGQPLEVSTAYWRDRDETAGIFGSTKYAAVARNLRPDHLAALPNETGECNWQDGCGAPRINKGAEEGDPPAPIAQRATNSVINALRTLAGVFGVDLSASKQEVVMDELIQQIMGDGRLDLNEDQLRAMSKDTLTALAGSLQGLPEQSDGEEDPPDGNDTPEPPSGDDVPNANEDPPCNNEMPANLIALASAIEERGGVESLLAVLDGHEADRTARTTALVSELAANERCAFTEERLAVMPVEDLETLQESLQPVSYAGRGGGHVSNQDGFTPLVMPDIHAVGGGQDG